MRQLSRVRKISQSDRDLLLELKHTVAHLVSDAEIVLYGSAARGTKKDDSDYDVLILTDRKLSSAEERELDRAIYDLQLAHGAVLSTAVYARDEWQNPLLQVSPYHRNVMRDGIVI